MGGEECLSVGDRLGILMGEFVGRGDVRGGQEARGFVDGM